MEKKAVRVVAHGDVEFVLTEDEQPTAAELSVMAAEAMAYPDDLAEEGPTNVTEFVRSMRALIKNLSHQEGMELEAVTAVSGKYSSSKTVVSAYALTTSDGVALVSVDIMPPPKTPEQETQELLDMLKGIIPQPRLVNKHLANMYHSLFTESFDGVIDEIKDNAAAVLLRYNYSENDNTLAKLIGKVDAMNAAVENGGANLETFKTALNTAEDFQQKFDKDPNKTAQFKLTPTLKLAQAEAYDGNGARESVAVFGFNITTDNQAIITAAKDKKNLLVRGETITAEGSAGIQTLMSVLQSVYQEASLPKRAEPAVPSASR